MLGEICEELNNWDFNKGAEKHFGTFTISEGSLNVDFLKSGQYFRVVGSTFNDGVFQYPTSEFIDETFEGAVWAMAVPKDVINLAEEVEHWLTQYKDVVENPYQSESFGGYSYSKKSSGSNNGSSNGDSWQSVFRSKLNRWRKM